MVDNVAITAGSGTSIATDDIGGVQYQRIKVALGADGVGVDATAGAGNVSTAVQRVTLATDDANAAAINTATTLIGTAVKAEDAAHVTADKGVPALAVRRDAKAVGSDTDGDYSSLNVTANGDLRVDSGAAFVVRVAPTVTAGAYSADDLIGGEMTITNAARVSGGGGILTGVTFVAEDNDADAFGASDIEVMIFDSNPAGTYTDNNALNGSALTDADATLLLGTVLLNEYVDLGDITMLKATNVNLPYVCSGSANLFAVAINRGAVTPEATDAVQFTFHFVRD